MDIKDAFDKEFSQKKVAADALHADLNRRNELAKMRMSELRRYLETLRNSRLPGLSWIELSPYLTIDLEGLRELTIYLVDINDELSIREDKWDWDELLEEKRTVSSNTTRVASVTEAAQFLAARIADDVARYRDNRFTRIPRKNGQGRGSIVVLVVAGLIVTFIITLGGKSTQKQAMTNPSVAPGEAAYVRDDIPVPPVILPKKISRFLDKRGFRLPRKVSKSCGVDLRSRNPFFVQGDFDGDSRLDYAVDAESGGNEGAIFVFFANGQVHQLDPWEVIYTDKKRGVIHTMDGAVSLTTDSLGGVRCESSSVIYVYDRGKRKFAKYFTGD